MMQKRTTPPPPLDITAFFPELAPLARRAVRLHPRRGSEPGPGKSKVGGTFLWPANEPWPMCSVGHAQTEPRRKQDAELLRGEAGAWGPVNERNREWYVNGFLSREPDPRPAGQPHGAYVGVIQLRAADVPELGFPEGCDLFQLLWCPRDHGHEEYSYWGPECRVYWRQSSTISEVLKEQPVSTIFNPDYMPQVCQFIPERAQDYPDIFALPKELQYRIWSWQETEAAQGYIYGSHLGAAPGMKIGDNVEWIQDPWLPPCPSCQQEMEHLLTVASCEWDGESFRRWRPLEEPPLAHGVPLQNGHADAGIVLGDAGNIYLFVCRRCPGWPIAYTLQCS
ncbi:hypothetical protein ccbrp13_00750 [Ktedonobacteria bacterium brp13]|nr:hypothetical protein ccbrp13_00750 [Ktedonobacteria bacterium brp13]